VVWCAWLCSVVHLLQHRSSNRRRGEPDPDRLAREHNPLMGVHQPGREMRQGGVLQPPVGEHLLFRARV
jgi:hypothetical protein